VADVPWYKSGIIDLREHCKGSGRCAPWLRSLSESWHPRLFEDIRPHACDDIPLEELMTAATAMGVLERAVRSARPWVDDRTFAAVAEAWLLCSMYLCLVYPRETVLGRLAGILPADSTEGGLCAELNRKDAPYRHIRNALAHGNFRILYDPQREVEFHDHEWTGRILWLEAHLLCLLVLDILMSAWACVQKAPF